MRRSLALLLFVTTVQLLLVVSAAAKTPLMEDSPDSRRLDRNIRFYDRETASGPAAEFMKKAILLRMTTQTMADDETLLLQGEEISFADKDMEAISVMTDGSKSHVYHVLDSGRQSSTRADGKISALKYDGIVKSVTKRDRPSHQTINAVLMDDGITYAVFSTNDIDAEEMGKFEMDSVLEPPTR